MLKRFLSSEPRLKEQSDAQTCVSRLVKSPPGELDFPIKKDRRCRSPAQVVILRLWAFAALVPVKPLAEVVAGYPCHDRQKEVKKYCVHWLSPPPLRTKECSAARLV